VFFVTDCLWLQGYKPSGSIAGAECIVRVYRGSLRSDVDGKTRNLGTAVVVLGDFGDGPACG
jgi:hypothetical protein